MNTLTKFYNYVKSILASSKVVEVLNTAVEHGNIAETVRKVAVALKFSVVAVAVSVSVSIGLWILSNIFAIMMAMILLFIAAVVFQFS